MINYITTVKTLREHLEQLDDHVIVNMGELVFVKNENGIVLREFVSGGALIANGAEMQGGPHHSDYVLNGQKIVQWHVLPSPGFEIEVDGNAKRITYMDEILDR